MSFLKSYVLFPALAVTALSAGPAAAMVDSTQVYSTIKDYYERNATEWNNACHVPRLQAVTRADVIEERDGRTTLDVRYVFRDAFNDHFKCKTFASRQFTIENGEVVDMSGEAH